MYLALYNTRDFISFWNMGFNISFLKGLLAEMSANKSDRSVSPAAINEESRRELLARQHRALYGNDSPAFFPPGSFADENSRVDNPAGGTPSSVGVRGPSPRSVDPFGLTQSPGHGNADGIVSPSRANSTSSPSSGINPVLGGSEVPVTSASPRADSPSSRQMPSKSTTGPIGSVGPIGSRPMQQVGSVPVTNPALNKRSTTPLPSPLGFGFTPNEAVLHGNERSTSSASNPSGPVPVGMPGPKDPSAVGLGWGNGGGVWGSKTGLGVQASVWG